MENGILKMTGRDLDVAVQGDGWLVVESQLGGQAMTRAGGLNINQQGYLIDTQGNQLVDAQGRPINIPMPVEKLQIRKDGMVEIRPEGAPADAMDALDRIEDGYHETGTELTERCSGIHQCRGIWQEFEILHR